MQKKKDKRATIRTNSRLKNMSIGDVEELYENKYTMELDGSQKTLRKISSKSEKSLKSGMSLEQGQIIEIQTNHLCQVEIGEEVVNCTLSGRLKQYNFDRRSLVAVGDYVQVERQNPQQGRVEEIIPRKNALLRYSEQSYQTEIIIAANIDQVIITASWALPMLKPGLIDRYLCLCAMYELIPVICVNKIDLAEDRAEVEEELAYYRDCGIDVLFTSIETGEGVEDLRNILKEKDSVFTGQSGVGKSSLLNMIEPSLQLRVGEVSTFNEKGVHTTTHSRLWKWSFGGHLIDTPGIKTVTLRREDRDLLPKIFPGFSRFTDHCYYPDCTHRHEDNCAVIEAVENDVLPVERYDSYVRMYDSCGRDNA